MALPSLRQLSYFVELAERLNFRAAAEAQFVTQSTLSAGIKELESVLGVQLVERDKRNVRLTAVGEEVVARARSLLAAANDLAESARSAARPLSGPLRLGTIPTIAPFLLPEILVPLRRAYPELKLYLREDLTERLLERLRGGSLDVALIALPYDTEGLHVHELFKDEFWFVAPEDDPAAREKDIAIRKLDPKDIVLMEEGHCLRSHAIAACGPRRGGWEARLEATSLFTLIQMVEGGHGRDAAAGDHIEARHTERHAARRAALRRAGSVPHAGARCSRHLTAPRRRQAARRLHRRAASPRRTRGDSGAAPGAGIQGVIGCCRC